MRQCATTDGGARGVKGWMQAGIFLAVPKDRAHPTASSALTGVHDAAVVRKVAWKEVGVLVRVHDVPLLGALHHELPERAPEGIHVRRPEGAWLEEKEIRRAENRMVGGIGKMSSAACNNDRRNDHCTNPQ